MAYIRLQPFTTFCTAAGTTGGQLTVGSTSGITRNCLLNIDCAADGWQAEVVRVVDGTHLLARLSTAIPRRMDLSAIPNGATVIVEEQWVQDLYQDDCPATLAIPVK